MKIVALALAPLVAVMALVFGVVMVIAPDQPSYACHSPADTLPVAATGATWDAEQIANARTILAVAQEHGVAPYGWVIGLAAAIQESGLHNLPYGDRDSIGLFQQRPSAGWGTPAHLLDPTYAATKFFEHLLAVPGWEQMSVTSAAQAVQRSGFPDAYASHEAEARSLVAQLAPGTDGALLLQTADCSAGVSGPVVIPLPPGTYRDLHNYGHSSVLWASVHTGDDLSAPCGTPVLAATAGTIVIESGGAWAWSGRWLVQVETGPGSLTTWYGHMRALAVVAGQTVSAGQRIGEVGDLGNATGCHLHFEVHLHGGGYGEDQVDPAEWLAANVGQQVAPTEGDASSFRLASFNVLGSSHTGAGGDQHRSWPSGSRRIVGAIELLEARGVSIAGLQEFESPQHAVFQRRYAGRWAAWFPGRDTRNAVIWRADIWQLAAGRSFAIPYISGTDQMPVVLLRSRATGAQVYVVNVHNPSNMYGSFAGQRDRALDIESRVVDQLLATGLPLVFTGDFNDRDAPGCTLAPPLTSAFGRGRGCGARPRESIDHIFGARIAFSATTSDHSPQRQQVSDHDLLLTTVTTDR